MMNISMRALGLVALAPLGLSAIGGCSNGDNTSAGDATATDTGGAGSESGSGGSDAGMSDAPRTDSAPDASAGRDGTGGTDGGTDGTDDGTDGTGILVDASDGAVFDFDDGSIPPDAALGSCARINWNVSASSSAMNNPPINAVDGTQVTRWSTGAAQAPGQYYEVDFGGYVQLSQITLNSAGSVGDYARGYEVAVSTDNVDFSRIITAASVDVPPPNDIITIDFPLHSARFLRINQTGVAGNWWSIQELTMVCRVPGPVVDPLACGGDAGVGEAGTGAADAGGNPFNRANWTAIASPAYDGGVNPPSNAFDGDITTKWSTGVPQAGNESFQLNLGSIACISQVWITTVGFEFATTYSIEFSVDGVTYMPVARGQGTGVTQIVIPPHLARFIRILQTGTNATNPWSINELAVLP